MAKKIESDTGEKNAEEVMINVTIVEFAQIAGYGTLCCEYSYVVSI